MSCIAAPNDTITANNLLRTFDSDISILSSSPGLLLAPRTNSTLSILTTYTGSMTSVVSALKTNNLILSDTSFRRLVSITSQPPTATPSSPTEQSNLESKNRNFFTHLQNEYRFYNCRFIRIYNLYIQVYNATTDAQVTTLMSASNIPQQFRAVGSTNFQANTLRNIASNGLKPLNDKLRRLSEISAAVHNDAIAILAQFRSQNSTINSDLNTAITALNTSSAVNTDIQKLETTRRAIEYTTEKNRYSNLYLGIYAFLNISAIAIILHIASS